MQSLVWDRTGRDGRPLPAGFYFARLRTERGVRTFPLVLL
jgi:hypothetical protein